MTSTENDLPFNTRVMAPLGDVLHPGVIVEPQLDHPGEGMVCVKFTPPVTTEKLYTSIDYITCPVNRVTLGWF